MHDASGDDYDQVEILRQARVRNDRKEKRKLRLIGGLAGLGILLSLIGAAVHVEGISVAGYVMCGAWFLFMFASEFGPFDL